MKRLIMGFCMVFFPLLCLSSPLWISKRSETTEEDKLWKLHKQLDAEEESQSPSKLPLVTANNIYNDYLEDYKAAEKKYFNKRFRIIGEIGDSERTMGSGLVIWFQSRDKVTQNLEIWNIKATMVLDQSYPVLQKRYLLITGVVHNTFSGQLKLSACRLLDQLTYDEVEKLLTAESK